MEPGQLCTLLLHGRDDLDAHGGEPFLVGGEAVAVLGRAVAQDLELVAGGGLAGAKGPLELAFGRGVALGGLARHFLEAVVPLDLPHQGVHPLVVVAIADDLASQSIRLATMWMWSCAVSVCRVRTYWLWSKSIPAKYRCPMSRHCSSLSCSPGAAERETCNTALVTPGRRSRIAPNSAASSRGRFPGHIGVKKLAFLRIEVVGHRALETRAFDGFGDHGVSPRTPSRAWRRSLSSASSSFTSGSVRMTCCPWLARRTSWLRLPASRPSLAYSSRLTAGTGGRGRRRVRAGLPEELRRGQAHLGGAGPEGIVFGGGDADADG